MVFQPDRFLGSQTSSDQDDPKRKVFHLEISKNFHVDHILIQVDLEGCPIISLQYLLSPSSRATPWSSSLTNFWDSKLVRIRMTPNRKLFISKIQRTFMLTIFSSKLIFKAARPFFLQHLLNPSTTK